MRRRDKKRVSAIIGLILVLVLVCGLSLLFGAVFMSPGDVWESIYCKATGICSTTTNVFADVVIWQIRMPRIVLAALVGALLAMSGTVLQGILRNPLADPYILGASAGGGVGAAIVIALGLTQFVSIYLSLPLLSFVGALLAVISVYFMARSAGRTNPETLILAGVAISSFASAILSLIIIFSGNLQSIYFWLLGGFSTADWTKVLVVLPYVVIGFIISYYFSKELNALLLGEEIAETLGVEVEKIRLILLACASIMTAAAVSVSGLIGFVGLIVPHFVRLIVGPHFRLLVPLSALSGMLLMVLADTIARAIVPPIEIPVGIVMALLGVPFFLYLLRRKKHNL